MGLLGVLGRGTHRLNLAGEDAQAQPLSPFRGQWLILDLKSDRHAVATLFPLRPESGLKADLVFPLHLARYLLI